MKPYFQTELGQIFHSDNREFIPQARGLVDMVLTDPPYGVNMLRGDSRVKEKIHGDTSTPDMSWVKDFEAVIWGGNRLCQQLPISNGWLVWFKYNNDTCRYSQAELAWSNVIKTVRHFAYQYSGFRRQADGGQFHPTQKPVALFSWCLNFSKTQGIVFDPYLGSGTTAIACEQQSRPWLGVEISEKYCEIAAKRIEKESEQLKLFGHKFEQLSVF